MCGRRCIRSVSFFPNCDGPGFGFVVVTLFITSSLAAVDALAINSSVPAAYEVPYEQELNASNSQELDQEIAKQSQLEHDRVWRLKEDSFDRVVENNKLLVVQFCTEEYLFCNTFDYEFVSIANEFADNGYEVEFARVDAREEKDLALKYSVKTYPTIIFFKARSPVRYNDTVPPLSTLKKWIKDEIGNTPYWLWDLIHCLCRDDEYDSPNDQV